MPFPIACDNTQEITVTCTPLTASGQPAQIDGALTVTVTSGNGTVTQDPAAPLAFTCVSGDTAGVTVYSVVGDALLGAGVTPISDTVELTVTPTAAVSLGFTAGAPQPKP